MELGLGRKRSRGEFNLPQSRARWASGKFSKLHPWGEYGAARVKRGTDVSLSHFGSSWKTATPQQRAYRKDTGFTGRGKYKGNGGFFSDLESIGNRFITKGIPNLINAGNMVKSFAGKGIYTGHGAYGSTSDVTHSNNLVSGTNGTTGSIPSMTSAGDETGAVFIQHREYITDVYGPTTSFNIQSYSINPALQSSYPWLSQLASNFDEYEFVQLVYEFRSTTTDIGNSTNGQCGTVIMATNYNAAAPAFTDKQQMMEYAHAHSCKTTEHMVHGVECDKSKTALSSVLYTRASPLVGQEDLKTYDHGNFQFAIANSPSGFANNPIGELWVYYKVMLRKPKLFVTRGLEIDHDTYVTPNTSSATVANVYANTAARPMNQGFTLYRSQASNLGVIIGPSVFVTPGVAPFQNVTTNNNQSAVMFSVTLPAAYNGNLRIHWNFRNFVAAEVTTLLAFPSTFVGKSGNVNYINDIYDAEGLPSFFNATSGITALTVGDLSLEVHVFVKSSSGGIDNTVYISLPFMLGNAQTPVPGLSNLTVSQYNGESLTSSTDLLKFINLSNGQVVGGNQI